MAKRRITHQQRRRIEDQRQQRKDRANDAVAAAQGDEALGPEQTGLVIEHFGRQLNVEASDGQIVRCHLRANLDQLIAGDRVIWQRGSETGVIVAAQERRSVLTRPDSNGQPRPVAANIDQALIVIAPEPQAFANLIDRYLIAAEAHDIRALLVHNKSDIDTHPELDVMLERYKAIGYPVLRVSNKTGEGLAKLKAALRDQISIFVGQSGVGKSSLVNSLLPEANTAVGALSEATVKGRHTTTTAKLFHFPDGGDLIDSPGIREFGVQNLSRDEVDRGFCEFLPYMDRCRFRDCRHQSEPGCALLAALEAHGKSKGVASLCIGGGEAVAMAVERV